ncbi:uncharacterized protein TrAtP1_011925 [Trichoderma atroviride]|uniref:uncharacterized protein n=1 Tax=Hypocrea atroviridis TaxID=63577 RepID=UPI0033330B68|nr:hypothetical protein TrAtP1_011925 [Trichoderma atroviride]
MMDVMVQTFVKDDKLCKRYAQFASDLDRWHFRIIYWFMFVLNLMILFVASWTYTKGQEAIELYSHDPRKRSRKLVKYMLMCLACVIVSAGVVIMEAFALLALQFCDGENLISLYWSTWTMTQVGSLIAMMGIILAMAHSLRNRRHPPWALALGTPVLVIAGLLHLLHDCVKKRINKFMQGPTRRNSVLSVSEVNTIQGNVEDDFENSTSVLGEFIGFTVDGGPIVRFSAPIPLNLDSDGGAELLGYFDGTRPVIAYQKGSIQFVPAPSKGKAPEQNDPQQPEEEKCEDRIQVVLSETV